MTYPNKLLYPQGSLEEGKEVRRETLLTVSYTSDESDDWHNVSKRKFGMKGNRYLYPLAHIFYFFEFILKILKTYIKAFVHGNELKYFNSVYLKAT